MKKKAAYTLAFGSALVGAANFVPGFWTHVPAPVKDAIPAGVRTYVGLSDASAPKVAAGPNAAQPKGPGGGGGGGGAGQGRPTPVMIAAVQKKSVPLRVEAIGTVQAIASVTVRARVDSQIEQVLFKDGADVKQGDVLVKLDSRAIEAQLRQAEGNLARDRATFELAKRTLKRGEDLANQNFATAQRLDENRASVNALDGQVKANEAQVENLKTQLSYYTIVAPISGKAGLANIKPGNIARSSDGAIALTTINQISPIYVSFSLPQRYLEELRASLARGDSRVEATPQGGTGSVIGKLALLENAIDNTTGTIGVRGVFENPQEVLWPGAICNIKITLREDADSIVVPREAVQMGQKGTFVFLAIDGVAKMRPVTVSRSIDNVTIVSGGLKGDESVIIDGQMLLVEGARVQPRAAQSSAASGGQPAPKL